jgi:hypothetical protein
MWGNIMCRKCFFKGIFFVILSFIIISCRNENFLEKIVNEEPITNANENINSGEIDYSKNLTENGICEIHNRQMYKGNIRIYYGLIKPTDNEIKYYELRSKYFYNSDDPINGGCFISDIKYFEEYICEECNIERDKYKNILKME